MADTQPPPGDAFPPLPVETLIPGLPNEIAFNCLIQVPRWYHPVLCAVSKPIRSLVTSPKFSTMNRAILNFSQHTLHIQMPSSNHNDLAKWFALHRTPNNSFLLQPIPPCPSKLHRSTFAVLGTELYVIGGYYKDNVHFYNSPHVWVLDCLSHRWTRGPSLLVPRSEANAVVLDGKIYVVGGAVSLVEVLDLDVGEWQGIPTLEHSSSNVKRSVIMNDKLCGFFEYDGAGIMYNLRKLMQEEFPIKLKTRPPNLRDAAYANGVLCVSDINGTIFGLDERNDAWKVLKGVRGHLPGFDIGRAVFIRMRSVGGRLVLMWSQKNDEKEKNQQGKVWCGEIEVKKLGGLDGDLLAKVHWAHMVPQLQWVPKDWVSISF
ncbi:hypothetical protein UlMin_033327 [Ulmus minor]